MDIRALDQFRVVAKAQNVTAAAKELRIAQPALSRTIARLESDLGVPLFDRQGRSIKLNRYGSTYLKRVESALQALDAGRREVLDAAGLDQGEIAVATENLDILRPALAEFRNDHPEVRLRLLQSPLPLMIEQLESGLVDVCVASQPMRRANWQSTPLRHEPVALAVPRRHRLNGQTRVLISELADEPIVTTRRGYWQRALLDQLFEDAKLQPRIVCEGDDPTGLRALVAMEMGVGLAPRTSSGQLRGANPDDIGYVEIAAQGCSRTLSLVQDNSRYVSEATRRFAELLGDHFGAEPTTTRSDKVSSRTESDMPTEVERRNDASS